MLEAAYRSIIKENARILYEKTVSADSDEALELDGLEYATRYEVTYRMYDSEGEQIRYAEIFYKLGFNGDTNEPYVMENELLYYYEGGIPSDAISETEPNNSYTQADSVSFGNTYFGDVHRYASGCSYNIDNDYFKFTTGSTVYDVEINLTCLSNNPGDDIDIILYTESTSPPYTIIGSSSNLYNNNEIISHRLSANTTYYIIVIVKGTTTTPDSSIWYAGCYLLDVNVTIPVTGISLNSTATAVLNKAVASENTVTRTATVIPSNAANQTIIWSVTRIGGSSGIIATVNSSGTVTGVAVGRAKVTAKSADGTVSASYYVDVIIKWPVTWQLQTYGDSCWAVTARMMAQVYAYRLGISGSLPTETQIYQNCDTNNWTQVKNAINYCLTMASGVNYDYNFVFDDVDDDNFTEDIIKDKLNIGEPIYLSRKVYNSAGSSLYTHASMLHGYSWDNEDNCYKYYHQDPGWNNTKNRWVSFEALQDETFPNSGRRHVLKSFIVRIL